MTPKEKAKEIWDKMMYNIMYNCEPTLSEMVAKECALIAVDEIDKAIDFDWMEVQNLDRQHSYWEQVRVEIISL